MEKISRNLELNVWAEELVHDVYQVWMKKYFFWKFGFKVFYGPITPDPKVMIISYQPGGNEQYFLEEDKIKFDVSDFSLHSTNAYLESTNRMARRMQDLFEGNERYLQESVTFPLIFFRSPSIGIWLSQLEDKIRLEMEAYCFSKVKQIFENVNPRIILVLGFKTFDLLQQILGKFESEQVVKRSKERLYCTAHWQSIRVMGIIHPTGSRISKQDWEKVKIAFRTEFVS